MEEKAMSGVRVHLIQSEDAEPRVRLTPGKRYEVAVTAVVDSDLQRVEDETETPAIRPSRLCGSKSTCVAIVEID